MTEPKSNTRIYTISCKIGCIKVYQASGLGNQILINWLDSIDKHG